MINKVVIIGRLTRDPYVANTNSGIKYARFTVAVDRNFGDRQADFVPVVIWRTQAEFVEKYIKKGALVAVEGRFSSSTYKSQSGETVTNYEVTADRINALETKAQVQNRQEGTSVASVPVNAKIEFEEQVKTEEPQDVPWDLDL